ncbi:MAG: rod shape-determining protein MreC [Spirochaetaceae bacterium]|nr:rod shape-determining protein MreC [Treponema sp.]MBP3449322.1 rod shape-determining protein MreC [Spirochaetaceae bacterium]MBQ3025542.1 rod shape-determining protein MreC [Spirochaetaceae bacterium]
MVKEKSTVSFKYSLIVFLILVIISGVSLALSSGGFIISVKEVGFSILSAGQKGVNSVITGVGNGVSAVKELAELKESYNKLVQQLEDYEYLQRNNAEIRKENELLREQLGISKSIVNKNYVAQIIGRDPDSLYSAITVNKGSRNGIRKNMPVIAVQNGDIGLVGKVVTVGAFTSQIMPIYDFQCNISARIQHTRDLGLVVGQGNADSPLQMQYIKKRVLNELQYGNVVVTSGENENYLKDIPIGSITKIKTVDYDSSLIIEITPIIDFARLETVMIVDVKTEQE